MDGRREEEREKEGRVEGGRAAGRIGLSESPFAFTLGCNRQRHQCFPSSNASPELWMIHQDKPPG